MEDFDKLKKICEENGFELLCQSNTADALYTVRKKKDIWEGVEFVENTYKGGIKKVKSIGSENIVLQNGNILFKSNAKPSTEYEYVEQLKKEAFERFGEIKEGDRFKRDHISVNWGREEVMRKTLDGEFKFKYDRNDDILYKGNLAIYKQGKWAKKITDYRVSYIDWEYSNDGDLVLSFKCDIWGYVKDKDDIGDYLVEQLQNYLNEKRT